MSRTRLVLEVNGSEVSVSGTVAPEDLGVLQKLLMEQGRDVAVHLGDARTNHAMPGAARDGMDGAPLPPAAASAGEEDDDGNAL